MFNEWSKSKKLGFGLLSVMIFFAVYMILLFLYVASETATTGPVDQKESRRPQVAAVSEKAQDTIPETEQRGWSNSQQPTIREVASPVRENYNPPPAATDEGGIAEPNEAQDANPPMGSYEQLKPRSEVFNTGESSIITKNELMINRTLLPIELQIN